MSINNLFNNTCKTVKGERINELHLLLLGFFKAAQSNHVSITHSTMQGHLLESNDTNGSHLLTLTVKS